VFSGHKQVKKKASGWNHGSSRRTYVDDFFWVRECCSAAKRRDFASI
jgi:hypothetical protein